jgi:hypothetical protein
MAKVKSAVSKSGPERRGSTASRSGVSRVPDMGRRDAKKSGTKARRVSYRTVNDLEEVEKLLAATSFSVVDGLQDPSSSFSQVFCDQGCNVAIADYDTHEGPLAIQVRMDWMATATQASHDLLRVLLQLQHIKNSCDMMAGAIGPISNKAKELLGVE